MNTMGGTQGYRDHRAIAVIVTAADNLLVEQLDLVRRGVEWL
jgi:hypothetical protein